jgi:putative NADH-flavin reductase
MEVARRMDIELDVLQPRDFDLVVDSTEGWSALYNGRKLKKPDVIIARTGKRDKLLHVGGVAALRAAARCYGQ